jgi:mannose-6-phosphate isomerase-like protein (cupin superfamily)
MDMGDGVVTNPISKERIALLSAAPDVLRLEEQVPPEMVPPPAHVHSHQAEYFEVIEGRATVVVSGVERTLIAGQSLTIDAGTPHTWQNSGESVLRMITEFRPAGQMQSFFETFCGLASEGRCDNKGQPAFLQIVASAAIWDMYLAGPPVLAQRCLFALLRPLAWARGYRAKYARFNGTLGL